jgi:hypothetical protein
MQLNLHKDVRFTVEVLRRTCIHEVTSSNLDQDTEYHKLYFIIAFLSSRVIRRQCLQSGHDCFLPNIFQFAHDFHLLEINNVCCFTVSLSSLITNLYNLKINFLGSFPLVVHFTFVSFLSPFFAPSSLFIYFLLPSFASFIFSFFLPLSVSTFHSYIRFRTAGSVLQVCISFGGLANKPGSLTSKSNFDKWNMNIP